MLIKSNAIDRLLRENPELKTRRFGLPSIGTRLDGEKFNPIVQGIADAIDFYGFEVRDENIATIPDINLGGGNSMKCEPFPLAIEEMKKSLSNTEMYKYPYTEGDDNIRKVLLDYIEKQGFINTESYDYDDIDEKGLSIHNLTFVPSTSIAFNLIINILAKPGDVILTTGPNYGLFTIRAERAGAEVEIIKLEKEDNFLINPKKLADKIDDINEALQKVYNRRKGYVPRVVGFLNTNPNNPTGKVMGAREEELLKQIGNVCLERGVFIIDDMVYRDITFDENNIAKPIATIPGMFRNTITLFGLSKSYGMASLRAGFIVADEIIIREIINRIFQSMDSSPDIVGRALMGAFNTTEKRKIVYQEYFTKIRSTYILRYQLLKALVKGIDCIDDSLKPKIISIVKNTIHDNEIENRILQGLPWADFPTNLEPESGFFAIIDFTKLRGRKYEGEYIITEKDLLKFFYKTSRIRFLVGQSISWPYEEELVARVTFALEEDEIVNALKLMNDSLQLLENERPILVRKNELKDQRQMAEIKVDGWRNAYKGIVDAKYLDSLDYDLQTERYVSSFEEYKDLVLVAVDQDEVLGYSCYRLDKYGEYDAELVSLYVKPDRKKEGIGNYLFRSTVLELQKRDRKHMILWCFVDNIPAIKFYEKLGGKNIATKEVKIGNNFYQEYGFAFDLTSFK